MPNTENNGGDSAPQSPRDRRIAAAMPYRKRWAEEVQLALTEANLSVSAAAKRANVSPGALQAWLGLKVEPAPRAMEALARAIGRQHSRLVYLLGWLPKELSDIPVKLEATEKLREALSDAQRWVEAATGVIGLSGGSLIANTLLQATADWEVTVRHVRRGRTHRAPYEARIAFAPADGDQAADPSAADTAGDRERILAHVRDACRRVSATWMDPAAVEPRQPRPDLVLSAPVLLASRPREHDPVLEVPESILTVGIPYTGGRTVASLLSTLLGWAYNDVGTVARERFGVAEGDAFNRAQAEVAKRLLQDPRLTGRFMSWSYASVEPIGQTIGWLDKAADALPLVVSLRADDDLLDYAAQQTGGDPAAIETVQNRVRRELSGRADPASYLMLDVKVSESLTGSHEDRDVLFDAYVEAAFKAARWLHERHGGPSLDQGTGLLAELWRQQQR
jgi:transcriptional regulator with XRE-family HTH domain